MRKTTLLTMALALAITACAKPEPEPPKMISNTPADIATATFADSLDIDISTFEHDANGLYWRDLTVGDGPVVRSGDTVDVYYDGRLPDGTRFDRTAVGSPFTFKVGAGQVIRGWDLGVAGMHVGGKRVLILPPALGYGPYGAGGVIPGNATLVFTVEVLAVH